MKKKDKFNVKFILILVLVLIAVLLYKYICNIDNKIFEGNQDIEATEQEAENAESGAIEGTEKVSGNPDMAEQSQKLAKSKVMQDGIGTNIEDRQRLIEQQQQEVSFNYINVIKTPQEVQQEIGKNPKDQLNILSYLRAGLKYTKIFVSAEDNVDQNENNYKIFKDTLGDTYLAPTEVNCNKCYNKDGTIDDECSKPAHKIINNIPQSENGIIPGLLQNVKRVIPDDAIKLIFPTFKMEKPKDLLNIKANDIHCIKSGDYLKAEKYSLDSDKWIMINGMYDTHYDGPGKIYEKGNNIARKQLKQSLKSEQFSNIDDNRLQDDMLINIYYFTLVCFFIYIISKIMIKH